MGSGAESPASGGRVCLRIAALWPGVSAASRRPSGRPSGGSGAEGARCTTGRRRALVKRRSTGASFLLGCANVAARPTLLCVSEVFRGRGLLARVAAKRGSTAA